MYFFFSVFFFRFCFVHSFFFFYAFFQFCKRHIHHIFVSFFSSAAKHPCPPTRPFRCRNDHVCLRSDQVCNKVDDCGDKSDEEECGEPTVHCYYLHSRQRCRTKVSVFSASFWRFFFFFFKEVPPTCKRKVAGSVFQKSKNIRIPSKTRLQSFYAS